jgi:hypothetical protein
MGTTITNTTTSQTVSSPPPDTTSEGSKTTATESQPQQDPQTEARNADGSKQLALGMRGQQAMQGQIIQQQLSKQVSSQPKIPSPAELARQHEEANAAKSSKTESNTTDATKFAPSKSAVQQGDFELNPRVEYEKLPTDLKGKLNQQLWARMGKENRATLIETYNRLKNYGLWDQVKRVTGEKDQPEPHVKVKGHEFEVAGNSGGIAFEAYDGAELVKKLKGTGHFGEDGKIIGALHKGQRSMREWGDEKSLHVSVGPGNAFDAHVDKVSPTNQPQAGNTKIDPVKGKNHHTTEVWPEKIRDKVKIPGVIVEGNIVENKDGWHGGELKVGVKVEWKGPAEKQKVQLPHSKELTPNPAPQETMEKIAARLEKVKTYFPTPIGSNPDWVPSHDAVAAQVAAQVLEAARNGKTSITIDLPQYQGQKGDQAKVLKAMEEIGQIVRSELIAAREALPEKDRAQLPDVNSVRGITVSFGEKNQRGFVSMLQ